MFPREWGLSQGPSEGGSRQSQGGPLMVPFASSPLHAALVVEALLGPQNADTVRARTAVICAVLHDVIDDTHVALEEVPVQVWLGGCRDRLQGQPAQHSQPAPPAAAPPRAGPPPHLPCWPLYGLPSA